LCGSKYSDSISHTKKLLNLLDKINTAMVSDMAVDCVCCESLDVTTLELFYLTTNKLLISKAKLTLEKVYYATNVKAIISHINQVRAPPIV
jgi:hypothetical protein